MIAPQTVRPWKRGTTIPEFACIDCNIRPFKPRDTKIMLNPRLTEGCAWFWNPKDGIAVYSMAACEIEYNIYICSILFSQSNNPWEKQTIYLCACTLVQKSYCYIPGVHVGVSVRVQNVRANVKDMEFQSLCIFCCILTLLIILIKPYTTKAHDRGASGDCGTSGSIFLYK